MKSLFRILRQRKTKDDDDYHCINCLYLFATKGKLKLYENMSKNHNHNHMVMPKEDNNILKYNKYKKYLKIPFIIYADTNPLLEKIHISSAIMQKGRSQNGY